MWQLLRDQLERHKWKALGFVAIVVAFVLVALLVPSVNVQAQGASPQATIARFGFYFWLFSFGWVGASFTMTDRRGLRVFRTLPVRPGDLARAWWFGATTPAVLMGGLAYVSLLVVDAVAGRVLKSPMAPSDLIAPGAAAFALVVVGSLTRDFVAIFDYSRGGAGFGRAVGPFWPAALGGLALALLGYLALRRSLGTASTPYRPVPATRPW